MHPLSLASKQNRPELGDGAAPLESREHLVDGVLEARASVERWRAVAPPDVQRSAPLLRKLGGETGEQTLGSERRVAAPVRRDVASPHLLR